MGCGQFRIDKMEVGSLQLKRVTETQQDVQYIRIEIVKDENTRLLEAPKIQSWIWYKTP